MARRGQRHSVASGFASTQARAQGKCRDCFRLSPGVEKNHVHNPCPDCLDRGALNIDGRVRTEGGELRGSTRTVGRRKLSAGCETCGGHGQVPNYDTRDPYQVNGWLVRGSDAK